MFYNKFIKFRLYMIQFIWNESIYAIEVIVQLEKSPKIYDTKILIIKEL